MASNPSEILNLSRHEHKLCLFEGHEIYKCTGCKQYGADRVFKCNSCPSLMLHEACAVSEDEYSHRFFREPLKFRAETKLRHHCNACGKVLLGFMFQGKDLKLHPLCMTLPHRLSIDRHPKHFLNLVVQGCGKYKCTECEENTKWKYMCEMTDCNFKLDMNCAVVNLHGMIEHGVNLVQNPSPIKRVMGRVSGAASKATVLLAAAGFALKALHGHEEE